MNPISYFHRQAHTAFVQGNYSQAAELYEKAIEIEPDVKHHYWSLGLMLLLQGQEPEAQTTWLLGMADGEADEIEQWTVDLVKVLQDEAERQKSLENYSVTWAIRQQIREIYPTSISNLLEIVRVSIHLREFFEADISNANYVLQEVPQVIVDQDLLLKTLEDVLQAAPLHPLSHIFVEACIPHIVDATDGIATILNASLHIAYAMKEAGVAASLANLCLRLDPENLPVLRNLASCYQNDGQYQKGIEIAKLCYSLSKSLPDQIFANTLILRGLLGSGGLWEEALTIFQHHEILLLSLFKEKLQLLDRSASMRLFLSGFFLPYLRDEPISNRLIQNKISQIVQSSVETFAPEKIKLFNTQSRLISPSKVLKIGYLSHCLSTHSVGWLTRWLFQHHDRERFQIHAYFMCYRPINDPLQAWYVEQASYVYRSGIDGPNDGLEIANRVYEDEIDILIDLDSITLDMNCEVLSLKPAPVQATWLGWDASGLPAIDYFIADPYVLPDSAQDYYSEKIWRLPRTYIAVDGFEVGVPTLRRDQLDIPSDAVIYLSAQKGYKRHRDTARLQIKILRAVPNSYFLVKGAADQEAVKSFFCELAEEEGVSCDRLRFLPAVSAEAVHRANLGIADVVLDTYPYNGATTTLETLWMGIPIVTRVGEQFAARNSYTMMVNVGVTEGIAWTDEEYIEWGVRLGSDPLLRQKISWKLKQSRQTAPLWNAKQFTRDMEAAYEQMWINHLENYPE